MLLALCAGAGCAAPGRPPVADHSPVFGEAPASYRVRAGDTLYSIAWRFELDHRVLARANGIASPYALRPGQRLRLRRPSRPAEPATATPSAPPRERAPSNAGATEERSSSGGTWLRPTEAAVARGFGDGNKGIDYRLAPADAIRATAGGEVVYAGNGLGGFRHLVIVKHDPAHLSAYGMDRRPGVREGQRVEAGARLAEESGGPGSAILHFEIREHGDPVDPGARIAAGG